jgi:hypothetical protein
MSREIRMVPEYWEHPKYEYGNHSGQYKPLNDGFDERLTEWEIGKEKWSQGLRDDCKGGWKLIEEKYKNMSFEEWSGDTPDPDDYMPEWEESEKTHYMMYETCSEGTPISPSFETREKLAHWLADNNASAFGRQTATYEQWLSTIEQEWVPTAVVENGIVKSGVEASEDIHD